MVAELIPPPPDAVAFLDALDAVLDSMSLDAYADLDVRTQRSVVDRIRRAKARLGAHELAEQPHRGQTPRRDLATQAPYSLRSWEVPPTDGDPEVSKVRNP